VPSDRELNLSQSDMSSNIFLLTVNSFKELVLVRFWWLDLAVLLNSLLKLLIDLMDL
jgi:hypothetical protein